MVEILTSDTGGADRQGPDSYNRSCPVLIFFKSAEALKCYDKQSVYS